MRGRFREFYQCDVDIIGSRSMLVETELIAAASEALQKLGFNDFVVRLNHREALTGLLACAGVRLADHEATLVALDKLDKVGSEGVARELAERGIPEAAGKRLLNFFNALTSLEHAADIAAGDDLSAKRHGLNSAILGRLVEFVGTNEKGARGVDDLRSILQYAAASGFAPRIIIDPSLARGLSYYTGAIIEINVKDLAGSLGGGGRYDNLIGMFSGEDVPACGFSLVTSPADVMVTIWIEDSMSDSVAIARDLRAWGLRVDLYPEADKLGKQFKYASERGIQMVVVLGEDEKARGEVAIKDMRSGEQRSVRRDQVAQTIRGTLNQAQLT
jgi:histidyl-tRNA synthetase